MIHQKLWKEFGDPLTDVYDQNESLLQIFYDQCTYPVRFQLMSTIDSPLEELFWGQLVISHTEESEDNF